MATPHGDRGCIICLEEQKNGILLLCCAPKQGEGEIQIICNPCAAQLHIHNRKAKMENHRFLPKCPHCRKDFSPEFLDNIEKIYSQTYTDEEKREINELFFKLENSFVLVTQQFIPYPEMQRDISALERYCIRLKKTKISEAYRTSQDIRKISKAELQENTMDALCTKTKTSARQEKRCCAAFRVMVKQNPNIFPKKSYRKHGGDGSNFDGFDANDAFSAFDDFLCF